MDLNEAALRHVSLHRRNCERSLGSAHHRGLSALGGILEPIAEAAELPADLLRRREHWPAPVASGTSSLLCRACYPGRIPSLSYSSPWHLDSRPIAVAPLPVP